MRPASTDRASHAPPLKSFAVASAQGSDAVAGPGTGRTGGDGAGLALALFSGGDERVFLDPATGRTKYGTPAGCAEDEVWFSSSTASAPSPRGYAAAATAWQDLLAGNRALAECCDEIRFRLTRQFGVEGTQAVLAGSGTEAVLLALTLARMALRAPLASIIVGCAETGRGVSAAAAGRHFLRHAAFAEVAAGQDLEGFEDLDIIVDTVEVRDAAGALRPLPAIDAELAQKVKAARDDGRDVIIHRLDVSKTGQSAPSLEALAQICNDAPDHVLVVADCCQLRCSAEYLKALLARGFLVSLTGSKFAGGPSFCGALLVPPKAIERLRPTQLPKGLAAYSAQLDWPAPLRTGLHLAFLPAANMGLALRWQAALAEIERFFAWPADLRSAIMQRFYEEVTRRAAATPGLDLLAPPTARGESFGHTIIGIAMRHADGRCFDMKEAAAVQRRLREGGLIIGDVASRCFHLGQPVEIGKAGILRVCVSAVLINRVAAATKAGASLSDAFLPIADTIAELFRAWPAAMALKTQ